METESSLLASTTEKAGGDGGVGEISGRIQKTCIDDMKNKRGTENSDIFNVTISPAGDVVEETAGDEGGDAPEEEEKEEKEEGEKCNK